MNNDKFDAKRRMKSGFFFPEAKMLGATTAKSRH